MSDDPYLPVIRTLYAKHIGLLAKQLALRQWLLEEAERQGRAPLPIAVELDELEQQYHEQLLLEHERLDPGLAAALDDRPQPDGAPDEEEEEPPPRSG